MRKEIILPLVFFLLGLFLLCLAAFLFLYPGKSLKASEELVSPIISEPKIGEIFKMDIYERVKKEKTTDKYPPNEFFPTNLNPLYTVPLDLTAQAYAVMDRDSKKLLLGKDITSERQIASLTKITTAIVALEKEKLDREIVIPKSAAEIGEASMGTTVGETYTLEELLYGLLLVSGNDAAEAIAQSLGRGRYWFIEEMNKKTFSLGMLDTYFVNPTGLDEESLETSSFSTALDLLALTNYALENPKFAEIVSTKEKIIPYKENYHKELYLYNLLGFDKTYPGIKGVKTGNTDFAGQTLISYCENQGKRIIVVLLESSATKDDVVKIYRYIFEGRLG